MSTHTLSSPKSIKPYKGLPMEGVIAKWYTKNTGRESEQKYIFNKVKNVLSANANKYS